nr:uncharacterized protein LOC107434221 [Ziziphus jujuba var. spinosa]
MDMNTLTSVVGNLLVYSIEPIRQQFVYLINYKENIERLVVEFEKLRDERTVVQLLVDDAKRNARVVAPQVVKWLAKVDQVEKASEDLRNRRGPRRLNGDPLNLKLRYSLGKKASKMTQEVINVLQERNFKEVGYPAPPKDYASTSTTGFSGLTSRIQVVEGIMQALKDEDINMIGICGAGGMGKTKMVEEVMVRAKAEKLFEQYAMAVVSQTPDERAIQDRIADELSLPLDRKESVAGRADKLRECILMDGKKILVILDSIWEKLDFDKVGLPLGPDNKSCKFILTTRNEDVCVQMNCQKKFTISYLPTSPTSNEASDRAQDIIQLRQEGNYNREASSGSTSRISVREDIMQALGKDEINMIGICGAGGIGKTKMVEEVTKRAKAEKLFEEFAIAVVSQTPDERAIQGQIADKLGLSFDDKESVAGRADRLRQRMMMEGKKILVILDDIWEKLDFNKVGLPLGPENKTCKFIITTRNEDVCPQMNCQKKFTISYLPKEEAWKLFRESAGNLVDDPRLRPIAEAVADECGGLPLAIIIVGRALENKGRIVWEHALQQLKKYAPGNITGMHKHVFSSIELSYNYLESKEAKSCFLLCCLFPEDLEIPIEFLVRYGLGLRLFGAVDTILEARTQVHALVDKLKRSFLLLDTGNEYYVKMHNVVRDFAISIGSQHEAMLVRCDAGLDEWPHDDSYEHYSRISLRFSEKAKFPADDSLHFTNLKLLQLFYNSWNENHMDNIPEKFFQGMEGLAALGLLKNDTPTSLPPSFGVLKNLRSLFLHGCSKIERLSMIGCLEKLEILSLVGSRGFHTFPREVGQLRHLKLLDLNGCGPIQRMERGTLSSLSRLEELYMEDTFDKRTSNEEDREEINASLVELKELSHLKVLAVGLPTYASLARDFPYGNLIKFRVTLYGRGVHYEFENEYWFPFENTLKLHDDKRSSVFYQLLQKTEIAYFDELKDLENDVCELDINCFARLKKFHLSDCEKLKYMVDWSRNETPKAVFPLLESLEIRDSKNLKEICHGQPPSKKTSPEALRSSTWLASFCNLRSLILVGCPKLKSIFSMSIARGLILLQYLQVQDCHQLKEIISKIGEDDEKPINETGLFPELTNLNLGDLPGLIGFNSISSRSKDDKKDMSTQKMDKFADQSQQYEQLDMGSSFVLLVTHSIRLSKLESLVIHGCASLQAIFDTQRLNVAFPLLESLEIRDLKNLKEICHGQPSKKSGLESLRSSTSTWLASFGNLRSLLLFGCPKLKNIFSISIARGLILLQCLEVRQCDELEEIISKIGEDDEKPINEIGLFPELTELELINLPELIIGFNSISSRNKGFQNFTPETRSFQNLRSLHVERCMRLTSLFPPCLAKLLVKLETLEVKHCRMMESIVEKEEEMEETLKGIVSFPKLNYLKLKNLPNFTTFSAEGSTLALPSLESLSVAKCPKAKTLDHMINTSSYSQLKSTGFTTKSSSAVPETNNSYGGGASMDSHHGFSRWLLCCGSTRTTLPSDSSETNIIQQRDVSSPNEVDQMMMMSKLIDLSIKDMGNMLYVWTDKIDGGFIPSHLMNRMNNLERMDVSRCQSLETIFHMERPKRGDEGDFKGFRNLKMLDVERCDNLKYLFSSHVAELLVELEEVRVIKCNMMEELILGKSATHHDDQEDHQDIFITSTTDQQQHGGRVLGLIMFKKLKNLEIVHCKNLRLPSHMMNRMNNLERMQVCGCESLETLFDSQRRPKSVDALPMMDCLMELILKDLPKLEQIWKNIGGEGDFKNLKSLDVRRCDNLKYLFSPHVAELLVELEEISVTECNMMEEIVRKFATCTDEQEDDHELLVELEEVSVTERNMVEENVGKFVTCTDEQEDDQGQQQQQPPIHDEKIFINSTEQQHGGRVLGLTMFKKLKNLEIDSCDNLRHVFSGSFGTRGLEQLQTLDIFNCKMMEHIVAAVANEENKEEEAKEAKATTTATTTTTMTNKIVFPRLASLDLRLLPKMERFCQGNYVLELPSLNELTVDECPMMRDLSEEFSFDYQSIMQRDKSSLKYESDQDDRSSTTTEDDPQTSYQH